MEVACAAEVETAGKTVLAVGWKAAAVGLENWFAETNNASSQMS